MTQDALELIFSRNAFYKRLHFYVLAALALSICMIVSLSIVIVYLLNNPTRPLYFAADNVSRLIKITPVTSPNMTTNDVMQWAIAGVQASYTYDYLNYRTQLQNTQKYFTDYGWRQYMKALTDSNNLLAVINRKQITIARVVSKPEILAEGILGGAYAWKFQMQLLVTYYQPPYDASSSYANALTVSVVVQRQEVLKAYKGLGIVQLVASMAGGNNVNQPQEISATLH